jgi:hypothetical protein
VVIEMGRGGAAAEAEALRYGAQPFGRSLSFARSTGPCDTPEGVPDAHRSEAHRWLSAGDADYPSPLALPAIADSRLPAHLEKLAGRARDYVEAASSENTRRAYAADWRHFAS